MDKNAIGTLLAVIISFAALGHTIWSDRQLRECDFLYNKNDRLIELKKKVTQVKKILETLRAEGRDLIQDADDDRMQAMIVEFITRQLNTTQEIYELFDLYQYAFSEEDLEKIEMLIQEIKDVDQSSGTPDQFLSTVLDQSTVVLDSMTEVSDRELKEVADRLRGGCSN